MEYLPIVKFLTNFAQRSVSLCQGRLVYSPLNYKMEVLFFSLFLIVTEYFKKEICSCLSSIALCDWGFGANFTFYCRRRQ